MMKLRHKLCLNFWYMYTVLVINKQYIKAAFFFSEPVVISPARWLAACFIPIMIAFYGYRKKSLNLSGALFGIVVGFVLTLSSFCFLATLLTFFMSSSKATKFRPHLKRKIEEDFKEGMTRVLYKKN